MKHLTFTQVLLGISYIIIGITAVFQESIPEIGYIMDNDLFGIGAIIYGIFLIIIKDSRFSVLQIIASVPMIWYIFPIYDYAYNNQHIVPISPVVAFATLYLVTIAHLVRK